MMSPLHYVGNLVLGGASVEGFNMEDMNGEVEVPSFCGSRISGGYIAAILCACVFGVLCLFAVGTVVFMCVRERRERRRWGPREEYFSSHQFDGANGDVPMSKLAGATSRYED
ncbi:hypothetical protein ABL78_5706 [Leptomonas seymouri]|uniref:Uncharacterized protein n=1 Tax=Leptomonas seymouri TaxID=5684 RepID=A0A0N1IJ18_LEPSE|nr:hypothetical protein ABL78_5706 [Leptomonas seymouri]|eukprot:KPI85253.1 hypothetical protein ABL78_5706 [Leptomonas seymouri]